MDGGPLRRFAGRCHSCDHVLVRTRNTESDPARSLQCVRCDACHSIGFLDDVRDVETLGRDGVWPPGLLARGVRPWERLLARTIVVVALAAGSWFVGWSLGGVIDGSVDLSRKEAGDPVSCLRFMVAATVLVALVLIAAVATTVGLVWCGVTLRRWFGECFTPEPAKPEMPGEL